MSKKIGRYHASCQLDTIIADKAWYSTPVMPVFCQSENKKKFKDSQVYIVRDYLKNKRK